MTRLNLNEASLLAASGELGATARAHLQAFLDKNPGAHAQYDLIKAEMELLRSLPRQELSDEQKRALAAQIKQGIHRKLQQIEHRRLAEKRRRFIYQALAGVSSVAATAVIVAGLFMMSQHRQQSRNEQIANAITGLNVLGDDRTNQVDDAINSVRLSVHELQSEGAALTTEDNSGMNNLLAVLASTSDPDEVMPPPEPGSL